MVCRSRISISAILVALIALSSLGGRADALRSRGSQVGPITAAASDTFYVDTGGSNTTGAGSAAKPWKTIQFGVDHLGPGDLLLINPGTYSGPVTVEIAASAGSPVTIRGNGSGVIVNGSGADRDAVFITSSSYVTVERIKVQDATRAGMRIDNSDHITARKNTFANNGVWGLFTDFSDDLLIEGNQAYGSVAEHGIYVSNSGDRPVIRGNVVHDNNANGIHMNGDLSQGGDGIISGAIVENNVIYNNGLAGGSGINMDGVTNSVIRNNLLYNNHASGISLYKIDGAVCSHDDRVLNNTIVNATDGRWAVNIGGAGCTNNKIFNNILYTFHDYRGSIATAAAGLSSFQSDYNVVMNRFGTDTGDSVLSLSAWRGMGYDAHSQLASPAQLFVGGGDYHLKASSPAIDAGTSLADVASDLDGNSRPIGARFDVGAYESGSAWPAAAVTLASTRGTVNSWVTATVSGFPPSHSLYIRWDGVLIGTFAIDIAGKATAKFRVPAAPIGVHSVRLSATGAAKVVAYEVAPRIKLIPSTAARGQTVDVSIRGFGAHETVRIRWLRSSSWMQVAQVTTSSTGSANADVKVPTWAVDGAASVRGDGPVARAQTNAFIVAGGPYTPAPTATPEPSSTVVLIPKTPTATSTPEPAPAVTEMPIQTPAPDASPVVA
ncbi:MAG: right-handed parallel beta-helix repeat-containing protein [Thermomicrobiales bacterium]